MIAESRIAPPPNPPTARPVTRPGLAGNQASATDRGTTYPNPIPAPERRLMLTNNRGNNPWLNEAALYPPANSNNPITAVKRGPLWDNTRPE